MGCWVAAAVDGGLEDGVRTMDYYYRNEMIFFFHDNIAYRGDYCPWRW